MNGRTMYWVDQHGQRFGYTKTLRELAERVTGNPGSKCAKMYCDGVDGKAYHTGYIIAGHWLNAFIPYRVEA